MSRDQEGIQSELVKETDQGTGYMSLLRLAPPCGDLQNVIDQHSLGKEPLFFKSHSSFRNAWTPIKEGVLSPRSPNHHSGSVFEKQPFIRTNTRV